jgi:hypothetical protein
MVSTGPFVAGRSVEADGFDTGVGSPCFIGKLLVPGYKDTVFLAAVQGDFGALIYNEISPAKTVSLFFEYFPVDCTYRGRPPRKQDRGYCND